MRLFISSLSSEQDQVLEVPNKFTTSATVRPVTSGEFNGFTALVQIGSRVYSSYRSGTSHANDPGAVDMQYSDDDGETWSSPIVLYDGAEVRALYDYIWVAEPDTFIDVRDPAFTLIGDGKLMLSGFITLKSPTAGQQLFISYFHTLNYSGNVLDTTIQSYFYYDEVADFGKQVTYNNEIYCSAYEVDPNHVAKFYKSTDNGLSFSEISTISAGYNESTIFMIDDKICIRARQETNSQVSGYFESIDGGNTWSSVGMATSNCDGLSSAYLGNGKVAFVGRNRTTGSDTDGIQTTLEVVDWDTKNVLQTLVLNDETEQSNEQGYSEIYKYRDRYFVSWYQGSAGAVGWSVDCGVFFRQLIYNEQTYQFSFE